MTYKKIYSSWEEIPANWNLWCLMREDIDKKIGMRYKSEGVEFLMYDFAVETGDNLLVGGSYSLLCMSDGDELIYMNPEYTSYYIISTSIAESWVENIRIYPNPATKTMTIQGLEKIVVSSIMIVDLSGRKVLEFEPESRVLDISPLCHGIYLLRIINGNDEAVRKILIE